MMQQVSIRTNMLTLKAYAAEGTLGFACPNFDALNPTDKIYLEGHNRISQSFSHSHMR